MQWCNQQLTDSDGVIQAAEPLRVEASHREFFRLHTNMRSIILMLSPPALERNEAFSNLSRLLHSHGMPVPQIFAHNVEQGWLLIEDLGDIHLEQVYATADKDEALRAAISLLPELAAIRDPLIEPYSGARMAMEIHLFSEWFVEKLLRQPPAQQWQQVFEAACTTLINAMLEQPRGCVHFDFHCRNILYTQRHSEPHASLGLVDFQDARHGPLLYDLASLLRDCYYHFSEQEVAFWLDFYCSRQPLLKDYSAQQIRKWFDFTALQRQLKAIGIFARLHLRDGRSSHLTNIAPVLQRVHEQCDKYPELHNFKLQLNDCIHMWTQHEQR